MVELGHRRKLLGFLFLLPLLLMFLFGAALGDEKVPLSQGTLSASDMQRLQNDQTLAAVFTILGSRVWTEGRPVRVLAAEVASPANPSSKDLLYVIPSSQNTSIVLISPSTASFYYAVLDSNSSRVLSAGGPKPIPGGSQGGTIPQVNVQPLLTDASAVALARDGVSIFRLGLSLSLTPEKRLLDVIFPELVGLEIGWVGVLGSAVTAVEDRVSGMRKRILMTPLSRFSFILGNAMASFILVSVQLLVLFAAAIFVFNLDVAGSLIELVPIIAAASFSVIGLGLIISHFSRTADEAFYLSALVNLPMGFLASQYIPQAHTAFSFVISSLFPMTYANRAFTAIIVNGTSLLGVLPELAILLGFAAGLYSLGTILLVRER
jgi:ABC-2 family transporter